jgi:hypothetical protein
MYDLTRKLRPNLIHRIVPSDRFATAERIGDLSTKSHGVSGTLHTLDDKTLFIQGFTYDGTNFFFIYALIFFQYPQ